MKKEKIYVFYGKNNNKVYAWTVNKKVADVFHKYRNDIVKLKIHKLLRNEFKNYTNANISKQIDVLINDDTMYTFTNEELNDWYSTIVGDTMDLYDYASYPVEKDSVHNIKIFKYIRDNDFTKHIEKILFDRININITEMNSLYDELFIDNDLLIMYMSTHIEKHTRKKD